MEKADVKHTWGWLILNRPGVDYCGTALAAVEQKWGWLMLNGPENSYCWIDQKLAAVEQTRSWLVLTRLWLVVVEKAWGWLVLIRPDVGCCGDRTMIGCCWKGLICLTDFRLAAIEKSLGMAAAGKHMELNLSKKLKIINLKWLAESTCNWHYKCENKLKQSYIILKM